jgi:hypothetical protein
MTAPKRARLHPWHKECNALSKYDWQTAVCHHPIHKNRPLDLRVANALMQLADSETLFAWPSQRTLARYAGVPHERQVRLALSSLVATGAIAKILVRDLDPEIATKVSRSRRGSAYRLKKFWAWEVFEASQKVKNSEPSSLRRGRELYRTSTVPENRTPSVRSEQDGVRPPNTESKHHETEKRAFEGKQGRASTRENRYAQQKGHYG